MAGKPQNDRGETAAPAFREFRVEGDAPVAPGNPEHIYDEDMHDEPEEYLPPEEPELECYRGMIGVLQPDMTYRNELLSICFEKLPPLELLALAETTDEPSAPLPVGVALNSQIRRG